MEEGTAFKLENSMRIEVIVTVVGDRTGCELENSTEGIEVTVTVVRYGIESELQTMLVESVLGFSDGGTTTVAVYSCRNRNRGGFSHCLH